jgi:hypothetical protein
MPLLKANPFKGFAFKRGILIFTDSGPLLPVSYA